MKRFLYKVLALTFAIMAGFVLFALAARSLHKKIDPYKWMVNDVMHFHNVPDGIKVCNLGSSHGLDSFWWGQYPDARGYNLALWSQRFPLDYAVLRQFHGRLEKGAVVILPISYFEICQYKVQGEDFRQLYYRFVKPYLIEGATPAEYLRYGLLPYFGLIKEDIKLIRKGRQSVPYCDIWPLHTKCGTHETFLNVARYGFGEWQRDSSEAGYKRNFGYACKIIDYCYKKGFTPVIVTTPITKEMNTVYDIQWPEFWDIFRRFSRELCEKYPALRYFDYSHNEEFYSDETHLFEDSSHLNCYGAQKFTGMVLQDLHRANILPR